MLDTYSSFPNTPFWDVGNQSKVLSEASLTWAIPQATNQEAQYDERGRLQPFVETSAQRRERIEFLRKRESSRRISAWLAHSTSQCTTVITQEVSPDDDPFMSFDKTASLDLSIRHDPSEEPDEPYVIYTASPFSSAGTPAAVASPAIRHVPTRTKRGKSSRSHLRRSSQSSSSLSSISEEDESSL